MEPVEPEPPWEIRMSERYNRHFYFNTVTRESVWEIEKTLKEHNDSQHDAVRTSTVSKKPDISPPTTPKKITSSLPPITQKNQPTQSLEGTETEVAELDVEDENVSLGMQSSSVSSSEAGSSSGNTTPSRSKSRKKGGSMRSLTGGAWRTKKVRSLNLNLSPATTPTGTASSNPFNFMRNVMSPKVHPSGSQTPTNMSSSSSNSSIRFSRLSSHFFRSRMHFITRLSSSSSSNMSIQSPTGSQHTIPMLREASFEANEFKEPERVLVKIPISVMSGLGRGGYSVVLKARHNETKEMFALKVISKERTTRKKDQDRLRRELKLMTEMDSRFLQKCHRCFESNRDLFFLLDFIDGGDLFFHLSKRQELKKQAFSELEVKVLLSEIYLGLEHLHRNGFIHRDIKIENIMLKKDGHVKLVDFGLAIEIGAESSLCGSLLYMSPEMLREKRIGTFTDWWSFGITFFELFAGRPPWSSYHDKNKIKREIMNIVVTPPTNLSPIGGKFLVSLLKHDFSDRLGTKDDREVAESLFFVGIDWEATQQGLNPPAFLPANLAPKRRRSSIVERIKEEVVNAAGTFSDGAGEVFGSGGGEAGGYGSGGSPAAAADSNTENKESNNHHPTTNDGNGSDHEQTDVDSPIEVTFNEDGAVGFDCINLGMETIVSAETSPAHEEETKSNNSSNNNSQTNKPSPEVCNIPQSHAQQPQMKRNVIPLNNVASKQDQFTDKSKEVGKEGGGNITTPSFSKTESDSTNSSYGSDINASLLEKSNNSKSMSPPLAEINSSVDISTTQSVVTQHIQQPPQQQQQPPSPSPQQLQQQQQPPSPSPQEQQGSSLIGGKVATFNSTSTTQSSMDKFDINGLNSPLSNFSNSHFPIKLNKVSDGASAAGCIGVLGSTESTASLSSSSSTVPDIVDNNEYFDLEFSAMAANEYLKKCSVAELDPDSYQSTPWRFGVEEISEYPPFISE